MRYYWLVLVLAVAIVFAGCGPRDRPPPPADTVVVDTVAVDTVAPVPADTAEEFGPETEVPLADTLLPPRARGLLSASSTNAGLRVGLAGYKPLSLWCTGFLGATTLAGNPEAIGPILRAAEKCGVGIGFTFPRHLMTENRQKVGHFSLTRGKALVDAIARAVPPDTLRKYTANRTLNYFSIMDDPGSSRAWGGRVVAAADVAQLAAYAQEKIGDAPIGVRIAPEWMASYSGWNGAVDMAIVQWHTKKRQPQAEWYQRQRDLMPRLGIGKLVYAVNVGDCDGPQSDPCSAEELLRYGAVAIDQPDSCGFYSWRYEEAHLRRADVRAAWETLVARGRAKDPRTCAR